MKRNFHSFKIIGEIEDKHLPILLVCNHMSWWDGIWTLHINQLLFRRKYHFMMREDQLRKNWFFQFTGGFSIRKNSKSVVETLNYTAELLRNPKNMVLIFPQGEIESMHKTSFNFENGTGKILQRTPNVVQTVFVANFVDYHSNPKPVLHAYLGDYSGGTKTGEIEDAYNRFYQNCIKLQTTKKEEE